jgi:hypothetical protein
MIRRCCTLGFVIALLACPSRSRADIAPNPITGGWPVSPYDRETTEVRMVAEDVAVRIYPDSVVTIAVFSMQNEGKTIDMAVGFPSGSANDVVQFRAFVDGKPMKVREGSKVHSTPTHSVMEGDGVRTSTVYWKLWDMTFRAGQRNEIKVEYKTLPHEGAFFWFQSGDHPSLPANVLDTLNQAMVTRHVEYILDTGRAWKGILDRCKVSFELVGLSGNHVGRYQPDDGVVRENRITWEYSNYEPRGIVNIEYLPTLSVQERQDTLLAVARRFPADARLTFNAGRYSVFYAKNHDAQCQFYQAYLEKWNPSIPQLMEYASGGRCRVNLKAGDGFFMVFDMANTLLRQYKDDGHLEKGRKLAPKLSLMSSAILDSLATCSSSEQSVPWLIRDATSLRDLSNSLIHKK